jgi:hypothetical protein
MVPLEGLGQVAFNKAIPDLDRQGITLTIGERVSLKGAQVSRQAVYRPSPHELARILLEYEALRTGDTLEQSAERLTTRLPEFLREEGDDKCESALTAA